MKRFEYAVKLTPDKAGGFVVTCRDLPEVVTQGESVEDALAEAGDAMDEAFAGRIDDREEFPIPTPAKRGEYMVAPPAEMAAKAALYVAMQKAGISNSELARRLHVNEKEVRRLLDPHHGSKLPRLSEAISALGARLVIGLEHA